ncbi:MAG: 50S ribosomal protein L11 methyltransferase [Acidimicrobiia bacterium]
MTVRWRRYRWKGRFGPFDLTLSEHTFQPSTVSMLIADVLAVREGDVVIDAGCGSGILSIIAAKLGASRVFGVDNAPDVVEVATANAASQGVDEVTTFFQGDLFDPLPGDVQADLIIGDVSGIPDMLARESGWFPGQGGGGPRGSELPIRMLKAARDRLRSGGRLLLPTGSLQDEGAILKTARSVYANLTKLVERNIPLPSALAASQEVLELVRRKVIELTQRGSRYVWAARVWECSPV